MSKIITLQDNLKIVYEHAAKEILNFTPQLYIFSKDKKLVEPFGSSVLIDYENKYYMITAAHCIMQGKQMIKIGIIVNGKLHLIKGKVLMNFGIAGKKDIGIIQLSESSIAVCRKSYKFLPKECIIDNKNISEVSDYLIVGFPITKTSIDYKRKKIKHEPLVYIAQSKKAELYSKLKFDVKQNTLLGFNKRRGSIINMPSMVMNPDPKGISGCGLWFIPSYFTEEIVFRLSGIMIEYYHANNVVVATKIEEVIYLLKHLNNE